MGRTTRGLRGAAAPWLARRGSGVAAWRAGAAVVLAVVLVGGCGSDDGAMGAARGSTAAERGYTPAAQEVFLRACNPDRDGDADAVCRCAYAAITAEYDFEDYIELNDLIGQDPANLPEEVEVAAKRCADDPSWRPRDRSDTGDRSEGQDRSGERDRSDEQDRSDGGEGSKDGAGREGDRDDGGRPDDEGARLGGRDRSESRDGGRSDRSSDRDSSDRGSSDRSSGRDGGRSEGGTGGRWPELDARSSSDRSDRTTTTKR